MNIKKIMLVCIFLFLINFNKFAYAMQNDAIGTIANIIGEVKIIRENKPQKAEAKSPIFETDKIITTDNSIVKLSFNDGSHYTLFQNSEMDISEYKITKKKSGGTNLKSLINVTKGSLRFFVQPKVEGNNNSQVQTANSVMSISGTTVFLSFDILTQETKIYVIEGLIRLASLKNLNSSVLVGKNQQSSVKQEGKPALPTPMSSDDLSRANPLKDPPPESHPPIELTDSQNADENIQPVTSIPPTSPGGLGGKGVLAKGNGNTTRTVTTTINKTPNPNPTQSISITFTPEVTPKVTP